MAKFRLLLINCKEKPEHGYEHVLFEVIQRRGKPVAKRVVDRSFLNMTLQPDWIEEYTRDPVAFLSAGE